MSTDTSKSAFIKTWVGGYSEGFEGYPKGARDQIVATCLAPFYDKTHTALEIGCGRGFWVVNYLIPNFAHVICLDVIPKPTELAGLPITYIELPDRTFDGVGVPDASIDFIWSFGLFCHLSGAACKEYLRSIYRMLKPTGRAVVMFGNWTRHHLHRSPLRDESCADSREDNDDVIWYYCDHVLAQRWCEAAGFKFKDLIPDHRDTLAYLEK